MKPRRLSMFALAILAATPVQSADFTVVNLGFSAYTINSVNNPVLALRRGTTYTFAVNALGHPFWIKSVQGTGTTNAYSNGVTNNGIDSGTLTFAVPAAAPNTLFYNCEFHAAMSNAIDLTSESPPAFELQWGTPGSGGGQFGQPLGVAADRNGILYVTDQLNARVQRFMGGGAFLGTWGSAGSGPGQFQQPAGVATDAADNVYVADSGNHRVQKFSSASAFLATWGGVGAGNGQMQNPNGIAVDARGNVYVADSGNNRIQKFTRSGVFLAAWGALGTANGQFQNPRGVAVATDSSVYVADSGNNRVQKFTSGGTFLQAWSAGRPGEVTSPYGVGLDASGDVIVSCAANAQVRKALGDGTCLASWGGSGSAPGLFSSPAGVAVDPYGNIYVLDSGSNRVQRFTTRTPVAVTGGSPHLELELSAYPNPARAAAHFALQASAPLVSLRILDVTGRLVRDLRIIPGAQAAEWDGCDSAGRPVSSGVYFVVGRSARASVTARIVLAR